MELKSLSDDDLRERLKTTHIFARMVPEQKLRVVKLLKELGHVVAMTGDGVNDAPSLKWADVGVAMGARGTDVAREASDIVLLDDNFLSIVSGIERGRLIFSNIRKAMSYIVSIHVPIAGLSIIPVLFNWPLILLPVHIVFLELIIDPACSLMFESQAAEADVMASPPRSLKTRLFSGKDLLRSFLQGLLVLVVVVVVLWYDTRINRDAPDRARAFAFVILAMSNLGLIFADMSGGSLRQLGRLFRKTSNLLVVFGVGSGLLLITQVTAIRKLFHFGPLSIYEFIGSMGVSALVFVSISLWNWAMRRRVRPAKAGMVHL
jgi:Ca2+-transporting ATPase